MALPSSGTISASMINTELGRSSTAEFSLNTARQGGYGALNPYSPALPPSTGQVSFASWYSYCHTCTTLYSFTVYQAGQHAGTRNFLSAASACSGTRDYPRTLYSSSSTLGVGSSLYYINGTQYVAYTINDAGGGEEIWLYDGTGAKPIRLTNAGSNVIDSAGACSFYWPNAKFGNDFFNLCFETPTPVYTVSSSVGVNTIIYLDAALTVALGSADYISIPDISGGLIWNIALFTGQITGDTGSTC